MTHDEVKEQLTLMALGEPADNLAAVLEHVTHCPACREFAWDVELVAARLPEALPTVPPPQALLARILAQLKTPSAGAAAEPAPDRGVASSVRPRKPNPWWTTLGSRMAKRPLLAGAAVALLLLVNAALLWDTVAQRREMATLALRYTDEVGWLRTAESLLLNETPPAARARLVPPAAGVARASGSAALYHAYDTVYYFLIKAQGLAPGTAYEVWLRDGSEAQLLGTFMTSDLGDGTLVHRSEKPPPRAGTVGVRPAGASEPALTGALEWVTADAGSSAPPLETRW